MPPPCRTCLATVPYAVPRPTDLRHLGESRNYVWALLPRAEDGSSTGGPLHHLVTNDTADTGDDWKRYIGQGRYYVFQVNVTEYGANSFQYGLNTLIIPEGVFYSTKFYTLLNSTDQANVTTNFSYLPTDTTTWLSPGNDTDSAAYIINIIVVQLNDSQAHQLVETLWQNDTGANTSALWSMSNSYPLYLSGFPLPVIEMAPHHYTLHPKQEPGTEPTFWAAVVDVLIGAIIYPFTAFYTGLVWIGQKLGFDLDWNIDVSWDDIVGAVTGFMTFMANIFKEIILGLFRKPMDDIKQEGQNGEPGAFYLAAQLSHLFSNYAETGEGNVIEDITSSNLMSTSKYIGDGVYQRLVLGLAAVAILVALILYGMIIGSAAIAFIVGGPLLAIAVGSLIALAVAFVILLLYFTWFYDADEDGLSTLQEWILAPEGADPNKKDLFVEIDYYKDYRPRDDALEYINAYYDEKGINIHLWVDDEIDTDDRHYRSNGVDKSDRNAIERWHHNRDMTYIYVVYVNYFSDHVFTYTNGTIAYTEEGNQSDDYGVFIAVEALDNNTNTNNVSDGGLADEVQTFMHEIGHNLGLIHNVGPMWAVMRGAGAEKHRNGDPNHNNDGDGGGDKIPNHDTITTAFPLGGPEYSEEQWDAIVSNLKDATRDYRSIR